MVRPQEPPGRRGTTPSGPSDRGLPRGDLSSAVFNLLVDRVRSTRLLASGSHPRLSPVYCNIPSIVGLFPIDMSLTPELPAAGTTELGVPGYTFADLHDPDRLASLYERFCEEVAGRRSRVLARVGRVPSRARRAAAAARAVEPADRHGAARQPVRDAAVSRRRRRPTAIARRDARAGRSVPLQGRLRAPPRAAAAQRRRARRVDGRTTTPSSRQLTAGASRRRSRAGDRARRLRADGSREGRQARSRRAAARRRVDDALKRWCAARRSRSRRIAAG